MTSINLNNLVKIGQLKTEPMDEAEFNGLFNSGKARLNLIVIPEMLIVV